MADQKKKEPKPIIVENKEESTDILILRKENTDKPNITSESSYSDGECSCGCRECSLETSISELFSDMVYSDFFEEYSCEHDHLDELEDRFRNEGTSDTFRDYFENESDFDLNDVFLLPIGLNNDELNKLNRVKYSQLITNIKTCSICYTDFLKEDTLIELKCLHIYYINCIVQWLISNRDCPYCKTCVL